MVSQTQALRQLKELEKHSNKAKDDGMRLAAESWNEGWQTLISTIMSARTRDEVTIPTADVLFKKYSSIEKLSKAKLSDIEKVIRPVNFYRNKSKNVLACAKAIVKEHGGKTPLDFESLILLPGVGRKTANVFLAELGGDNVGVDTHVFYISRYLGWAENKNPHKVEEELKQLFPKKYWGKVNAILVRFGKTHTSRKKKDALLKEIRRIK